MTQRGEAQSRKRTAFQPFRNHTGKILAGHPAVRRAPVHPLNAGQLAQLRPQTGQRSNHRQQAASLRQMWRRLQANHLARWSLCQTQQGRVRFRRQESAGHQPMAIKRQSGGQQFGPAISFWCDVRDCKRRGQTALAGQGNKRPYIRPLARSEGQGKNCTITLRNGRVIFSHRDPSTKEPSRSPCHLFKQLVESRQGN